MRMCNAMLRRLYYVARESTAMPMRCDATMHAARNLIFWYVLLTFQRFHIEIVDAEMPNANIHADEVMPSHRHAIQPANSQVKRATFGASSAYYYM